MKITDRIKKAISVRLSDEKKTALKWAFYKITNLFEIHREIGGRGNRIRSEGAFLRNVSFSIAGDNNQVEVLPGTTLMNSRIQMVGNRHRLIIGEESYLTGVHFYFEDHDCRIHIDAGVIIYAGAEISAAEPGRRVTIGKKCLLATGVDIRTTDSHAIVHMDSKAIINPGADVIIEDHVWLGKNCTVLKGVWVGSESIIGIGSVVTRNIPGNCVAAGIPAKVIKENVTWMWEREPKLQAK